MFIGAFHNTMKPPKTFVNLRKKMTWFYITIITKSKGLLVEFTHVENEFVDYKSTLTSK